MADGGAHVGIRGLTRGTSGATFVCFDPFVPLYVEDRFAGREPPACVECGAFSVPRTLFSIEQVLNQ